MSDSGPQAPLPNPIGPIEPNVTIAGLEAIAVAWTCYYLLVGTPFVVTLADEWHWYFAIYGVFALLGVLILGLATEGLAGVLERAITRRWWGKRRGIAWQWYQRAVLLPPDWGPGQRWMWKSEQASREFARRRLRLLVSRNTAACFLVVTIFAVASLFRHGSSDSLAIVGMVAGLVATALFGFLWLDAHNGWNRAVADAGKIGEP